MKPPALNELHRFLHDMAVVLTLGGVLFQPSLLSDPAATTTSKPKLVQLC